MSYQSFPNQPGDSDSQAKLQCLKFPEDMTGKSFLDLGCNEGFFCLEAKRRGASRVAGLDANVNAIQLARERAKNENLDIQFIHSYWNTLPDEQFDFILLASSLHYETHPIWLFNNIYNHLTTDGILILECGVLANHIYSSAIHWTPRANGNVFHPRLDTLLHVWLSKFAVRDMGSSVMQAGDPVPREVFHCKKWKTTVIFVMGMGNTGKSNLLLKITEPKNIIQIDTLFFNNLENKKIMNEYEQKIGDLFTQVHGNIKEVFETLKSSEVHLKYLANVLFKAILLYQNSNVVFVEGYGLQYLLPLISEDLKAYNFRYWKLTGENFND